MDKSCLPCIQNTAHTVSTSQTTVKLYTCWWTAIKVMHCDHTSILKHTQCAIKDCITKKTLNELTYLSNSNLETFPDLMVARYVLDSVKSIWSILTHGHEPGGSDKRSLSIAGRGSKRSYIMKIVIIPPGATKKKQIRHFYNNKLEMCIVTVTFTIHLEDFYFIFLQISYCTCIMCLLNSYFIIWNV